MRVDYQGRHVVVTGGTGALGTAVTAGLVSAGAVCHLPARGEGGADKLPEDLRGRVDVSPLDLGDEKAVRAFYEGLPDLWASVQCAGAFAMGPVEDTPLDDLRKMMEANLFSCFLCCREAVRKVRGRTVGAGREGVGRIVNVTAQPALDPRRGAGMLAYTASKAAVAAMTVALAEEVAADGLWVNAVAPSVMDTPANRKAMPDADHAKWPTVKDVAATIVFLASPQNTSSRGGIVPVFGRA